MKTDLQLQAEVLQELQWDPAVQATSLGVEVKDGVVTLSGLLDSAAEKWHALHAVQRVAGVQGLASALTVRLPGLSPPSDADIAAAVIHRLAWHAALADTELGVAVQAGQVTLSGTVRWQYQREAALACVHTLRGVLGVHDDTQLRPSTAGVVMSSLREALERAAGVDAGQIQALVRGHEVTLTGTVPHWAGRQSALAAAWALPGVRAVRDQLTLAG
ncbi:BON domain-containing protein [Roseateles cellulosilyticus]|uniref:BON domain-containing protein n=1 Tax=Pelomonas cellulosilytica TaxID=2906762 RepID=A0ABS8Y2H7_9BURK|nr:BON domain-containing protein [Pelomonas sp. P8]MCE4557875.1 BON domain-containing protein [Pelomonas sp. P8]